MTCVFSVIWVAPELTRPRVFCFVLLCIVPKKAENLEFSKKNPFSHQNNGGRVGLEVSELWMSAAPIPEPNKSLSSDSGNLEREAAGLELVVLFTIGSASIALDQNCFGGACTQFLTTPTQRRNKSITFLSLEHT